MKPFAPEKVLALAANACRRTPTWPPGDYQTHRQQPEDLQEGMSARRRYAGGLPRSSAR